MDTLQSSPSLPDIVRWAAVAGRVSPGAGGQVRRAVTVLFAASTGAERPALAVMCPHAGWIYSGELAARTLHQVQVPGRVVILCPNHTGRGARVSVFPDGAWRVPGGDVPVDAA